jgi:hypothetical protein
MGLSQVRDSMQSRRLGKTFVYVFSRAENRPKPLSIFRILSATRCQRLYEKV